MRETAAEPALSAVQMASRPSWPSRSPLPRPSCGICKPRRRRTVDPASRSTRRTTQNWFCRYLQISVDTKPEMGSSSESYGHGLSVSRCFCKLRQKDFCRFNQKVRGLPWPLPLFLNGLALTQQLETQSCALHEEVSGLQRSCRLYQVVWQPRSSRQSPTLGDFKSWVISIHGVKTLQNTNSPNVSPNVSQSNLKSATSEGHGFAIQLGDLPLST